MEKENDVNTRKIICIPKNNLNFETHISINFGRKAFEKQLNKQYKDNTISTTKYNLLTFIPKSLLFQFLRAANIYFLIISILTLMDFSPKSPVSMIGTFAMVLVATMIKEAFEDLKRYQQDKEINQKEANVYTYISKDFAKLKWADIHVGDLIRLNKDNQIPADILLISSSLDSGMCFVDTMNLDGETNLKEKMTPKETSHIKSNNFPLISGHIICNKPNESLEKWDSNVTLGVEGTDNQSVTFICGIKQLLLKGSVLKNTEYIYGIVVYTGHETKIMKNAKSPRQKTSNVMGVMNKLLYSVFFFQFLLCIFFSMGYILFQNSTGISLNYLKLYGKDNSVNAGSFFIRALTFLVAYSHLIPISLYVALEIVKIIQGKLITADLHMFYHDTGESATARTSDLIEELGQVEFIFSDKTGTLTKNEMVFRKCSIFSKIYDEASLQNMKKNIQNLSNEERNYIHDFFTIMAVCHSAYVEEPDNSKEQSLNKLELKYQSSSPDEIALILGSCKVGYKFIKKTSGTIEILNPLGELEVYDLILELPFDSERKRMSVIVKLKGYDEVLLFTKGADSHMLPNLRFNKNNENTIINQNLSKFAKEGLRTLVMGNKILTNTQVSDYLSRYKNISMSSDADKETQLSMLYEEIEKDLNYIGSSAIEDKLQDDVPETIESLINAGIRVWVLTGDKKETAIEIGKSCKMVFESHLMDVIDLAIELKFDENNPDKGKSREQLEKEKEQKKKEDKTKSKEQLKQEKDQRDKEKLLRDKENERKWIEELTIILNQYHKTYCIEKKENRMEKVKDNKNIEITKKLFLIIDGTNLAFVLNSPSLSKKFFEIGILANSVICCRVSPKQKSDVVKLAKSNGSWITLSIGDGANDVSMIMEAHIGVGISGKEGSQAVRSADYAISQFKFLKRLLFIHGRLGYRRISFFICYYFYKNIILVFTEMYFAIYNGFSGQIFFPDMLPLCYNSFWTSWPPIFSYSLERDVDDIISMNFPILYKAGQIQYYFNMRKFWEWIVLALIHGVLVFYGSLISLKIFQSNDGLTKNHWYGSTIAFTCLIHIVNYKIFIALKNWNKLLFVVCIISFLFYYFSVFVMCVPGFSFLLNNELSLIIFDTLSYFKSYIIFAYLPIVCLLPDIFLNYLYYNYFPNPSDIIFNNRQVFIEKAMIMEKEALEKKNNAVVKPAVAIKKSFIKYGEDNIESNLKKNLTLDLVNPIPANNPKLNFHTKNDQSDRSEVDLSLIEKNIGLRHFNDEYPQKTPKNGLHIKTPS